MAPLPHELPDRVAGVDVSQAQPSGPLCVRTLDANEALILGGSNAATLLRAGEGEHTPTDGDPKVTT